MNCLDMLVIVYFPRSFNKDAFNPLLYYALLVQVATTFDLSDQSKTPKLIAESTWNYEI